MKKRTRHVVMILLAFCMIFLFTVFTMGCSCSEVDRDSKDIVEEEEKYGCFVVLSREFLPGEGYLEQYIMYDPQTKIMWTFIEGNDSGGLSIIYDVDGTPILYEH